MVLQGFNDLYDTICIIRLIWTCKLQNRNKFFCIKICMMQFLKHRTNSISSYLYEENQPIKMRVSHYSNIWRLNQKYRRINLKGTWLIVCSYHITYAFQSESTFYSCLNVKEFLARNRREIWSLSDCNWTQTHNHFARKQAISHLAKLAKWLYCVVSIYLYGTFGFMFLSYHVRVPEWIHSL